jgi:hypothetical protein
MYRVSAGPVLSGCQDVTPRDRTGPFWDAVEGRTPLPDVGDIRLTIAQ